MNKEINKSLLKDANYVCIAKELWDDGKVKKHGYLIVNKYDIKANNIQNMADAAKFCASQIFWGTYGGLFGEGWEIEVKVSDGFLMKLTILFHLSMRMMRLLTLRR